MKYPIYKNPVFRVEIQSVAGLTKVSAGGVFAPLLQKTVLKEMAFFDRQKYIAELSENAPAAFSSYFEKYGDALIYSTWMPPIPSPAFSRMVQTRMGSVFGKYRPEQVTLSITEECPNKCLHCALPNKNKIGRAHV